MNDLDLTTRTQATYQNSHFEVIFGVIAGLLMAAAVWRHQAPGLTAGWLTACLAVYAGRFLVARRFLSGSTPHAAHWTKLYVVGAALAGLVWGVAGWTMATTPALFPAGIVTYWIALAVVSAGLIYAGSYAAIVVFIVTATAPTIAALLRLNSLEMQAAAGMVGFLAVLVVMVGRVISRRHLEALTHEGNIKHLASLLDQRRNQVEKLNVALKTNADKREQAEQDIRKISADLGLAKSKAKALSDTLARVSTLDNVTELHNRKRFEELVAIEWRRNLREKKPLSILVAAFDDYQDYVESHGRQAADTLLKRIAKVIRGFGRRAGDEAGRYADDRLALLLPGTDTRNAARIAEAVRRRVEGQQIPHAGSQNRLHLTVHVGVATMIPAKTMEPGEVFKRVETALYEAQFRGGNRVVVYQAIEKLRIERWDQKTDGELNEQSMLQKMLVWGLEPNKLVFDSGETILPEDTLAEEVIFGVLAGSLKLVVEGHEVQLKPGDAIFVPAGVTASAVVDGSAPLLALHATRSGASDGD